MRLLFSFTLQGQKQVGICLKNINKSKIPLNKCRFFYTDNETKSYLESKLNNKDQIIQSCGLSCNLDQVLNTMRLSKNKPAFHIIGLDYNTRITRYKDFERDIQQFQSSIINIMCIFSTKFTAPCTIHNKLGIDTRVIICNNIHKDMLTSYIETCEQLDSEYLYSMYTNANVLENMPMTNISVDFSGLKNKSLFHQFFLMHFSDYDTLEIETEERYA